MSIMRYISFPRKLKKHQISYIKLDGDDEFNISTNIDGIWDYGELLVTEGRVDGRISIWDILGKSTFNKCFNNPFVYEFGICIPDYYREQRMEITKRYSKRKEDDGYLDYKAMDQELYVYWGKVWSLESQVLYKYLHDNLNTGEFVEIYESWVSNENEDENGITFSPPTTETVITLEELPSLPLPKETLDFSERKKLTIHKI